MSFVRTAISLPMMIFPFAIIVFGCDVTNTPNNTNENAPTADNVPPLCASKSDIERLHNSVVRIVGTYSVIDAGKTEVAQVSIDGAAVTIGYGVTPEDALAYDGKKVEVIGRITRDYVDPNDENSRFMQRLSGPHLHGLQSIKVLQ